MRYQDHLEKTRQLREEIARLKTSRPGPDEVVDYLIEVAEALTTAARALIEMRLKTASQDAPAKTDQELKR